jgi:hypothetical protein
MTRPAASNGIINQMLPPGRSVIREENLKTAFTTMGSDMARGATRTPTRMEIRRVFAS